MRNRDRGKNQNFEPRTGGGGRMTEDPGRRRSLLLQKAEEWGLSPGSSRRKGMMMKDPVPDS